MEPTESLTDAEYNAVLLTLGEQVQKHLLWLDPPAFLAKYVTSLKDLYEQRFWVRSLPSTDDVLRSVVGIVHSAVVAHQRFRTEPCFKIVKTLVKQRRSDGTLPPDVIDMLFDLYTRYIGFGREGLEWCISVFIKDTELEEHQIQWLVDHWSLSDHIINRLLLYPGDSMRIREWAREMVATKQLMDRRSELLALLADEGILERCDDDDTTKAWAVYKSSLPTERKVRYLEQLASPDTFEAITDIARRLRDPRPLQVLLRAIQNSANNGMQPTALTRGG